MYSFSRCHQFLFFFFISNECSILAQAVSLVNIYTFIMIPMYTHTHTARIHVQTSYIPIFTYSTHYTSIIGVPARTSMHMNVYPYICMYALFDCSVPLINLYDFFIHFLLFFFNMQQKMGIVYETKVLDKQRNFFFVNLFLTVGHYFI